MTCSVLLAYLNVISGRRVLGEEAHAWKKRWASCLHVSWRHFLPSKFLGFQDQCVVRCLNGNIYIKLRMLQTCVRPTEVLYWQMEFPTFFMLCLVHGIDYICISSIKLTWIQALISSWQPLAASSMLPGHCAPQWASHWHAAFGIPVP